MSDLSLADFFLIAGMILSTAGVYYIAGGGIASLWLGVILINLGLKA